MLRALRDQPGLIALVGDWHGGDTLVAFRPLHTLAEQEDPFAALGSGGHGESGPDAFHGGWMGYLGFQLAGDLERLPPSPPAAGDLPPHHLGYYDHVVRRSANSGQWTLEALPDADPSRVDLTAEIVTRALDAPDTELTYQFGLFSADAAHDRHAAAVTRALGHIRDGDIFQANVCRSLAASFEGDPLDVFCAGYEALTPRFAAFLRLPRGNAVVSLSPELFLRRTGDSVLTSPIKGTAPADSDPERLRDSVKNRAENVMIVDLMRNDLSRVCVAGTVTAHRTPRVEPHTGVYHLVADVAGRLRPEMDDGQLLRATFPPGSCTGAPKIRAMSIIHQIEPHARQVYTGAIGYAGAQRTVLNVAIRTFEFSGSRVRLGVGGAVVADSDPAEEAHETLIKAAPLLDAVGARFDHDLRAEWDERTTDAPRILPRLPRFTPDLSRGVFTTMLVESGVPVDVGRHLARLGASVRACFDADLPAGTEARVRRRAAPFAQPHRLRVDAYPSADGVQVALTASPLQPAATGSWRLVPMVLPGGLGEHKWADRDFTQWEPAPGLWTPTCDPMFISEQGEILETGKANIFVVLPEGVLTPPADGRILPGVRRATVIEALCAEGVRVQQTRVTLEDLARATEVFITNSLRGVQPVALIDGVGAWNPGPVSTRLI